jgi:ribosomal protein S18 acetylase RimI-like enzyme
LHRLSAANFAEHVPGLADLLVDAVTDGASLGFLAPLDAGEAARWWWTHERAIAEGDRLVWVRRGAGRIDATVTLVFDRLPNGRHRAHIVKLIVHRDARGRGLGRELLGVAEHAAAAAGSTLLMLDTETGSAAEHLYRSAGWTCYGVVPGYATDPSGVPQDCSFFYKDIGSGSRVAGQRSALHVLARGEQA